MEPDIAITAEQAAKLLGVSSATVKAYCRRGWLIAYKSLSERASNGSRRVEWRIARSNVDLFMNESVGLRKRFYS